MNSTSSDDALRAVHQAIIRARCLAYTGTDAGQIAHVLDDVEYLATIILRREEVTEEEYTADLRRHLQDMEQKFAGFNGIVQAYDESRRKAHAVAA